MTPKKITLHCSDSPNGHDVTVEEIRQWHLDRDPPFKDIGYHFVIEVDGALRSGRPLNVQGAHVEGANEDNVGICMVGRDKFTPAQWRTLRQVLRDLQMTYSIPDWSITLHYEHESARAQGKTCPGFKAARFFCWYLAHDERAIEPHLLKLSAA